VQPLSSGFVATATGTSPCEEGEREREATMPAIAPRPIMITLAAARAMRDWILMRTNMRAPL
jgi:hypothetical protein